MKKIALLLVVIFVLTISVSFADIIAPNSGEVEPSQTEEATLAPEDSDKGEEEVKTIAATEDVSGSTEDVSTTVVSNEVVQAETTGNPVGGIIAIGVVLLLVLIVAAVSKK